LAQLSFSDIEETKMIEDRSMNVYLIVVFVITVLVLVALYALQTLAG
jgi:hypothetical protein